MTLCSFDGGPLHEADRDIPHDTDGDLPLVLVTDEGDYWVTYVLCDAHHWPLPTYSYMGEPIGSERDTCPVVPPASPVPEETTDDQ